MLKPFWDLLIAVKTKIMFISACSFKHMFYVYVVCACAIYVASLKCLPKVIVNITSTWLKTS